MLWNIMCLPFWMMVLGSAGDVYEEEGVGDGALEWTTFFF